MRYAIALCAMLLVLGSCKKKETQVTVMSNAWQTTSPYGLSYLFYKSDGTTSQYNSFLYGIHTKSFGHYNAVNSQIEYSDGGSSASFANYHISNDTLYIENAGATVVYVKAATLPDTANWIRKIQVIEKFPIATRAIGGLDYDGSYLVMRGTSGKVYRISTTTHQLIDSVTPGISGRGLACLGANTWLTNSTTQKFDQLDFATNTITASSSAATATPAFACADASTVYYFDVDGNLKSFVPPAGAFNTLAAYPILAGGFSGGIFDLHYYNGKVLASGLFGLLEFNPATNTISNTYSGAILIGVTAIGNELWAIGFDTYDAFSIGTNAQPYIIHFSLN